MLNVDGSVALDREEFPRPQTTAEGLSELKDSFGKLSDFDLGGGVSFKSQIQRKYPDLIGNVTCAGYVAGIQTVKRGTKQPDHDLAHRVIELGYQKGLLMFAPVGAWGQTVKICPPLTMKQDALEEGIAVLHEAFDQAVSELK